MPASRFLKYIGRNWPNPVYSFYLPVSISRDATVIFDFWFLVFGFWFLDFSFWFFVFFCFDLCLDLVKLLQVWLKFFFWSPESRHFARKNAVSKMSFPQILVDPLLVLVSP